MKLVGVSMSTIGLSPRKVSLMGTGVCASNFIISIVALVESKEQSPTLLKLRKAKW